MALGFRVWGCLGWQPGLIKAGLSEEDGERLAGQRDDSLTFESRRRS